MRITKKLVPILVALSFVTVCRAQETTAQARLVRLSDPVYPPIARQARITGVVEVEVIVHRDGSNDVNVLSGHPMLKDAAITSARSSEFDGAMCSPSCSYLLRYSFTQSVDGDCCAGSCPQPTIQAAMPKVVGGREQMDVTVVTQPLSICDPAGTITKRRRSAKCLYLWKCSTVWSQ